MKKQKKRESGLCIECKATGQNKYAHYLDEHGNKNRLCAMHAKLRKTWVPNINKRKPRRKYCIDCEIQGKETQAVYADENGKTNQFCAKHAKIHGVWIKRGYLCILCPKTKPKIASYADEKGKAKKYCAKHAREKNCDLIEHRPYCVECLPNKIYAKYPKGTKNTEKLYCMLHAKAHECYEFLNPCKMCPKDNIKSAHFKDEMGKRTLCSEHARENGTYALQYPCIECLVEPGAILTTESFQNVDGKVNLCEKHALKKGLITKSSGRASMSVCKVFDQLEKELNIELQHAHFKTPTDCPSIKEEYNIPGTNYHVDAFDAASDTVYEYQGTHVHGVVPSHPDFFKFSTFLVKFTNAALFKKTILRLRDIRQRTKFNIFMIWSNEERKLNGQPISSILHNLNEYDCYDCDSDMPTNFLIKQHI